MSTIVEEAVWDDAVYEIQDGDQLLGGPAPDGILNKAAQALANRTLYLKTQLEALRDTGAYLHFQEEESTVARAHDMVWIPRVTIPAGALDGWPAADLVVGGFAVDTYLNTNIAKPPWDGSTPWPNALTSRGYQTPTGVGSIADAEADTAARDSLANKLLTAQAWAEATLVMLALGAVPSGNNNNGRDGRDPDAPEWYGQPSQGVAERTRTGTGPGKWWPGKGRTGPADWFGNLLASVRMDSDHGYYEHPKAAKLASAITASAAELTLKDLELPELWPDSGTIELRVFAPVAQMERVTYGSLVTNPDGTVTFGAVVRGVDGTTPLAHVADTYATGLVGYCLVPGGVCLKLLEPMSDTDPSGSPFQYEVVAVGPGGMGSGLQMLAGGEWCSVSMPGGQSWNPGDTVTINPGRGQHGTAPATHATGARVLLVPSGVGQLVTDSGVAPRLEGWLTVPRQDGDLVRMMLPEGLTVDPPAAAARWGDWCTIPLKTSDWVGRGAHYGGSIAQGHRGQILAVAGVTPTQYFGARGMRRE